MTDVGETVSAYLGRERFGRVLTDARKQFEAFDAGDASLGCFDNRTAALDAIREAAQKSRERCDGSDHALSGPGRASRRTEADTMSNQAYPAFVFQRDSRVEREAGFLLAGDLIVDARDDDEAAAMGQALSRLIDEAKAGRMPDDALVFGWHGDTKPPNAADTKDNAIMNAWADRSIRSIVRIEPAHR